jgi:hypothetical protein
MTHDRQMRKSHPELSGRAARSAWAYRNPSVGAEKACVTIKVSPRILGMYADRLVGSKIILDFPSVGRNGKCELPLLLRKAKQEIINPCQGAENH